MGTILGSRSSQLSLQTQQTPAQVGSERCSQCPYSLKTLLFGFTFFLGLSQSPVYAERQRGYEIWSPPAEALSCSVSIAPTPALEENYYRLIRRTDDTVQPFIQEMACVTAEYALAKSIISNPDMITLAVALGFAKWINIPKISDEMRAKIYRELIPNIRKELEAEYMRNIIPIFKEAKLSIDELTLAAKEPLEKEFLSKEYRHLHSDLFSKYEFIEKKLKRKIGELAHKLLPALQSDIYKATTYEQCKNPLT